MIPEFEIARGACPPKETSAIIPQHFFIRLEQVAVLNLIHQTRIRIVDQLDCTFTELQRTSSTLIFGSKSMDFSLPALNHVMQTVKNFLEKLVDVGMRRPLTKVAVIVLLEKGPKSLNCVL